MTSILQQFWDIESLGIVDEKRERHSLTFLPRITFKDNRYEVGLPWREAHLDVSDHYNVCLNCLQLLHRRLLQDPELLKEYDHTIQEQLSQLNLHHEVVCRVNSIISLTMVWFYKIKNDKT